MKPEHFDILGALAFAYISIFAIYALVFGATPHWSVVLLAVIGIGGLIVDIGVIFFYFVRKNKK